VVLKENVEAHHHPKTSDVNAKVAHRVEYCYFWTCINCMTCQ